MNKYGPEGILIKEYSNHEFISTRAGLERALEGGVILESEAILCDHGLNLHISLGEGVRGIIPREEVEYNKNERAKDIAILTRVGKPVCFKVRGFERAADGGTVAILSRKEAQRECTEAYINGLRPGDIIPSRITHLESFGAFVDIGCGIISLLSIDSISISRISHPSERVTVGELLYTVVKEIDDRGRIYVSERELLGSWLENASLFTEGETVRGIIRSVESYGVFVELKPNLAGLAEFREDVFVGQTAAVYIKSIIPEKMKIKLIIISTHEPKDAPEPLEYFIDTDSVFHIDSWKYSPPDSRRTIETVFR